MMESTTKPITTYVESQVERGAWREEIVPAALTGMPRDIKIYRAPRKQNRIKHDWHGTPSAPDRPGTFCPAKWFDIAIGSGACGLGCRGCFLMLTFRALRDPLSPLVHDNLDDYQRDVRDWLTAPRWKTERDGSGYVNRTAQDTLGLSIDSNDSLLYEGITHHARTYIPLFSNPATNPRGNKLVLLTKTANTFYLEGLPTQNVAVTFSLNPEPVADAWEGKFPDTLERMTPPIRRRLEACRQAQDFGFETRWRIDPILPIRNWGQTYRDFFAEAAALGLTPTYVTLGTYREKINQLDLWRSRWGLPAMEWEPDTMIKEGSHRHVPFEARRTIYETIIQLIRETKWKRPPAIELCKETHEMRRAVGFRQCHCNCLQ